SFDLQAGYQAQIVIQHSEATNPLVPVAINMPGGWYTHLGDATYRPRLGLEELTVQSFEAALQTALDANADVGNARGIFWSVLFSPITGYTLSTNIGTFTVPLATTVSALQRRNMARILGFPHTPESF